MALAQQPAADRRRAAQRVAVKRKRGMAGIDRQRQLIGAGRPIQLTPEGELMGEALAGRQGGYSEAPRHVALGHDDDLVIARAPFPESTEAFVRGRVPLGPAVTALAIENLLYTMTAAAMIAAGTVALLVRFQVPSAIRGAGEVALWSLASNQSARAFYERIGGRLSSVLIESDRDGRLTLAGYRWRSAAELAEKCGSEHD